MKISFKQKGDYSKITKRLRNSARISDVIDWDSYGKEGVAALAAATPVESGLTANSWYHEVTKEPGKVVISFNNSNVQDGVPIAIILQYGHATRNGSWVAGEDYINPVILPIFKKIKNDIWKEVIKRL